jgi:hypothetical protein
MITTEAPQKAERRVTRGQFREWLVTRHFSPRTVECYVGWAIKLAAFTRRNPAEISGEQVREFLTHLANSITLTFQNPNPLKSHPHSQTHDHQSPCISHNLTVTTLSHIRQR